MLVKLKLTRDKTHLTDSPLLFPAIRSEERSVSKVSIKLQSLARPLFPFRTLFQSTLWLTQKELLPALLRARQPHTPLRDDVFKEQFKCIVQRDFLNKAQKIFAVTFAYKRGKQTFVLPEGESPCVYFGKQIDFMCRSKKLYETLCGKFLTTEEKDL